MANNSLHVLRSRYASSLKEFIASPRTFEILDRVPTEALAQTHSARSLFVLDSSFNPPTAAHLDIASSALQDSPRSSRLLLLLATQNADKPTKPASFEDRLVMMNLFAQALRTHLESSLPSIASADIPQVDIGVTKKPYFVDKAAAIELSGEYSKELEQIHLTGYDTLIRIFNPKYYPPTHTLQPLEPFLSRHRLRVTTRPDDEWGNRQEQEEYLQHLARGGREHEGGKREWAERIELVLGHKVNETPVSSTRARNAAQSKDVLLHSLVPAAIGSYIMSQELYHDT